MTTDIDREIPYDGQHVKQRNAPQAFRWSTWLGHACQAHLSSVNATLSVIE